MYQFIKQYLPSKENERKQQELVNDIADVVSEAKQDVSNGQDMEFELSLAMNKTSTSIDKLEKERDILISKVKIMEDALKDMSNKQLTDDQMNKKNQLEQHMNGSVKKAILNLDREIDNLTRQLLLMNVNRDKVAQRKVYAQDEIESAISLPTSEPVRIADDTVLGADVNSSISNSPKPDSNNNNEEIHNLSNQNNSIIDNDTRRRISSSSGLSSPLVGDNQV